MTAAVIMKPTILVIDSGSSSVKFALFDGAESLLRRWSGVIECIGLPNGHFHAVDANRAMAVERTADIADHSTALSLLLVAVEQRATGTPVAAVGHRVVHGGPDCDCPLNATAALEERLRQLIPLAPLHRPNGLVGIEAVHRARPDLAQVARVAAVAAAGCAHPPTVVGARKLKYLPEFQWINTVLGNPKTRLNGCHHAFDFRKYAARYLAGFTYRFNRRFDLRTLHRRLLVGAARCAPHPQRAIRMAEAHC